MSFLNALFSGYGCAAGVELFAYAEVELSPRSPASDAVRPSLVGSTARAALRAWGREDLEARVSVRSEVPVRVGLKSSSAVATAVEHAVVDALRCSVPPIEVARLGSEVAMSEGYSATGAFDDALGSVLPGVHFADNLRRRAVGRFPPPEPTDVVLWLPPGSHPASPAVRTEFRAASEAAEPAKAAATRGDWATAMALNSATVERVMGYEYAPLRRAMADAGALASGVSGLGPAFAAVTRPADLERTLRALPRGAGEVVVTRFLRRPTGEPT